MKKIIFGILVICSFAFSGISVDWTFPSVNQAVFTVFEAEIIPDGNITEREWSKTAGFPLRSKEYICRSASRIWAGPIDSSMEFYCAWNHNGLYFAAIVADNEIINDRPPERAYEQDCIEVFVDGRTGNRFMRAPYSKGCYQILIKPPVEKSQPVAVVFGSHKIEDIVCKGITTKYGYNIELFIPWSAFPDIKKPDSTTSIAIQAMLDDYDRKDGEKIQPLSFSLFGRKNLSKNPQNFIQCVLAGKNENTTSLSGVFINCPFIIFEKGRVSLSIETMSLLFQGTGKDIKVRAETENGKQIFEKTLNLHSFPVPWEKTKYAKIYLDTTKIDSELIFLFPIVNGVSGKQTASRRTLVFLGNIGQGIIEEIKKADIPKKAETEPFRALAYMAVGTCYEKIKRAVETADTERLKMAVREAAARIDVLKGKQLKTDNYFLNLLTLCANPQAQVIVEYPSTNTTSVSFYWASIPLATVRIKKFSDENAARDAAKQKMNGLMDLLQDVNPAGPVVIAGLPARASSWSYMFFYFNISWFNPEKHIMIVIPRKKKVYVLDKEKIDYADTECVVISEYASEDMKKTVRKYILSSKTKPAICSFEKAMEKNSFLFLTEKIPESLLNFKTFKIDIVKQSIIRIPYRDMLVSVSHPSRWVAEEAVNLVVKGKPVSESDVEIIRKTLVNEFAFSMKSSEKVKRQGFIYCGDLHSHSTFSDGNLSPVGMVVESMYCFMDFFALTDHNTIEGAKIVSKLLAEHGFNYTFLIGEEITTKSFHFNAYPLKKTVSYSGSAEEIIAEAKQQSALVQWNHPGWTNSQWELSRLDQPLNDTGLDAWEHIPLMYYQWKKQDVCPPLVGSTDSHDGTFSNPERTIIFSSDLSETSIIDAIKNRRSILVSPGYGSDYLYGENIIMGEVWDALFEAQELKKAKQDYITRMLKNSDLAGLLLEKYEKPHRR